MDLEENKSYSAVMTLSWAGRCVNGKASEPGPGALAHLMT